MPILDAGMEREGPGIELLPALEAGTLSVGTLLAWPGMVVKQC